MIDVDSGWRPNQYFDYSNYFSGTGDELCDLGGDVFLSENIFLNVFKDDETSDRVTRMPYPQVMLDRCDFFNITEYFC